MIAALSAAICSFIMGARFGADIGVVVFLAFCFIEWKD